MGSTAQVEYLFTAKDRASPTIKGLKANIAALGSKTGGPLGAAASAFGGLALGAAGAGVAIGVLTDLGGKVSQFLGDSISAASDLNETITKTEGVLGDSSDDMLKWAETAAHTFGQSKGQALDAAVGFAGLFKTVGQSADAAGEHARTMTELGADLASFYNTDMKTALESLRSGLSGEAEPMRKFNVFLSEAAVDAKLMALGLEKVNGKWTEAQKIQGRYAIIMERTADAQGDFAATQTGMANASREFSAALEDLKTDIGEDFLGFMEQGSGGANDLLVALQAVTDVVEAGLGIETLDMTNPILTGLLSSFKDMAPGPVADVIKQFLTEATTTAAREAAEEKHGAIRDSLMSIFNVGGAAIANPLVVSISDGISDAEQRLIPQFREVGRSLIADDLAGAIRGNKDVIADAMDTVAWAIKHPMALTRQVAALEGAMTTLEYKRGLASNTEGVNTVIDQQLQGLRDQWSALTGKAWSAGAAAGSAWRNAYMNSLGSFNVGKWNKKSPFAGSGWDVGPGKRKKRAAGGPFNAGDTLLVGERGPELLHIGRNGGSVTPNHKMGGNQPIYVVSASELARILDQEQGRRLALSPYSAVSRG